MTRAENAPGANARLLLGLRDRQVHAPHLKRDHSYELHTPLFSMLSKHGLPCSPGCELGSKDKHSTTTRLTSLVPYTGTASCAKPIVDPQKPPFGAVSNSIPQVVA